MIFVGFRTVPPTGCSVEIHTGCSASLRNRQASGNRLKICSQTFNRYLPVPDGTKYYWTSKITNLLQIALARSEKTKERRTKNDKCAAAIGVKGRGVSA